MSEVNENVLEHHIDAPIKNCIMGLNLLGLTTKWSCCGFDYQGQPSFKSHVHGRPHVVVDYCNGKLLDRLVYIAMRSGWKLELSQVSCTNAWQLSSQSSLNQGSWARTDSAHFHEGPNTKIKSLEHALMSLWEYMNDLVVLRDQNHVMETIYEHWQYKGLDDWEIKKVDLSQSYAMYQEFMNNQKFSFPAKLNPLNE